MSSSIDTAAALRHLTAAFALTLAACAAKPEASAPESGAANAPYGPQGYPQQQPADAAPYATAQPTATSAAPMTLEEAEIDLQRLEDSLAKPSVKLSAGPDACLDACKALSSMKRAADRICELTAPAMDRCASVRERVTKVETRVVRECPACP